MEGCFGCGSLNARHIGFGLSYGTAALLFWRVFFTLCSLVPGIL